VLGIFSSWSIVLNESRHVEWRELLRLLPYTIVGALIGLYFYNAFDARTLARGLGALILAYGSSTLWQSLRQRPAWKWPPDLTLPVQALSPASLERCSARWRACFTRSISICKNSTSTDSALRSRQLVGTRLRSRRGYLAVGAYDREALIATAISLPLMFVGVALGNRIHTNLSEIAFRRLLSIVLISSGVPLMLG